MKIQKDQIKRIHTLKAHRNMSEEDYRAFLAGFEGAKSCKDLTYEQARKAITLLQEGIPSQVRNDEMGDGIPEHLRHVKSVQLYGWGANKYECLGSRPGMAEPAQLRKIEAIWATKTYLNDPNQIDEGLRKFLEHKFRISHITFIRADIVERIIKAVQSIKRKAG